MLDINNDDYFNDSTFQFSYINFVLEHTLETIPLAKTGIKIKEKNKGKFTQYCGGKVTDACIQRGKNSSDPTIRKRANFAKNARAWKHQQGGTMDFSNFFSNYYGLDNDFKFGEFKLNEIKSPTRYTTTKELEEISRPLVNADEVDLNLIPSSRGSYILATQTTPSILENTTEPIAYLTPTTTKDWSSISRYSDLSLWAKDFITAMKKHGNVSEAAMNYLLARSSHESGYGKKPSGEYNYGNLTVGVLNWDGSKYDKTKGTKRVLDGSAKNSFKHYNSMDDYVRDAFAYMLRKWKVDLQKDDLNTIINKTRGWSEFNINEYLSNTLKYAQGLANK